MKKHLMEFLEQRGLSHLFNETDYNTYKRKVLNGRTEVNKYFAALVIGDMFIFNSPTEFV